MNPAEREHKPFEEKTPYFKMVSFDMDGLLIKLPRHCREDSNKLGAGMWDIVFNDLGIPGEHKRLKNRYLAGEFPSYMEWTDEACKILKANGLTREKFSEIINRQNYTTGAKETVAELKKQGYKTAVVTGSFKALARRVQEELGVDEAVAHCDFQFDEKGKLKRWELTRCDSDDKIKALLVMSGKHGINASECIFVGHDINDISVSLKVGLSIAFGSSKPAVKNAADITISGKDLRLILRDIDNATSIITKYKRV
jgi:phosphoserine phosphatase